MIKIDYYYLKENVIKTVSLTCRMMTLEPMYELLYDLQTTNCSTLLLIMINVLYK